jgi:hypothetical protein
MKSKPITALMLCVLLCSKMTALHAQTIGTGTTHSFHLNASRQSIQDLLMAPTSYHVSSAGASYGFEIVQGRVLKRIGLGIQSGSVLTEKDDLKLNSARAEYVYAGSIIKNRASRFQNFSGYSLSVNAQYLRAGDKYSWATTVAAGLFNSTRYSWRQNRLLFDFTLPFIGFSSRPQMSVAGEGDFADMLYNSFRSPELATIGSMKSIDMSLELQHFLSSRFAIVVSAAMRYRKLVNEYFAEHGFQIGAGLEWHLK